MHRSASRSRSGYRPWREGNGEASAGQV
ncbi:unnamed protein product [Victoria cruziana]